MKEKVESLKKTFVTFPKNGKAIIIGGNTNSILIRPKSNEDLEIGELLISEQKDSKTIMNILDMKYSSQISEKNIELISGLNIEEGEETTFFDENLRNYKLAVAKPLITINKNSTGPTKTLPKFFGKLREIKEEDFNFLTKPEKPLFMGNLRSGSKKLDLEINIDGEKAITHHILIAATTGRGKSNLVKTVLWKNLPQKYSGILILDPHDEYFLDEKQQGMKKYPEWEKYIEYYTPNAKEYGEKSLIIDIKQIKPIHFRGIINLSDAQEQMLNLYYKKFKQDWIEKILMEEKINSNKELFQEATQNVIKRQLMRLLNIQVNEKELNKYETETDEKQEKIIEIEIQYKGIFQKDKGETIIQDICNSLEQGKKIIINTSTMDNKTELLVGSIITEKIFSRYKQYKLNRTINQKPVISIVLEEAPRVIGKDAISRGGNIFSTIAKEGRKFKIGLLAITQIPSEIPRDILANMNTKIILGNEMRLERQALIDSAAQDLSDYDQEIASLSKGEAIITSTFTKMALPVKFPLFKTLIEKDLAKKKEKSYKEE